MKIIVCCSLLLMIGITSVYSSKATQFRGIVINVLNDSIEIKKGNKEITLYWSQNAKIFFKGKKAGRQAVEICQKVKAQYEDKNNRKELTKLEILNKSYCTQ